MREVVEGQSSQDVGLRELQNMLLLCLACTGHYGLLMILLHCVELATDQATPVLKLRHIVNCFVPRRCKGKLCIKNRL